MILLRWKIYFKQSRKEKISWIILGFNLSKFSGQVKNCHLEISKNVFKLARKRWLVNKLWQYEVFTGAKTYGEYNAIFILFWKM